MITRNWLNLLFSRRVIESTRPSLVFRFMFIVSNIICIFRVGHIPFSTFSVSRLSLYLKMCVWAQVYAQVSNLLSNVQLLSNLTLCVSLFTSYRYDFWGHIVFPNSVSFSTNQMIPRRTVRYFIDEVSSLNELHIRPRDKFCFLSIARTWTNSPSPHL